MSGDIIIAIPPLNYIHVLDKNTNVTSLIVGPTTYFRKDHEKVEKKPQRMIIISKSEYCKIKNPVCRDDNNEIIMDIYGQPMLAYGDEEYRFSQTPFPLYPGEILIEDVKGLSVLTKNEAFLLTALVTFTSTDSKERVAGEQWLFEGPGIYVPQKEVKVVSTRKAEMIKPNTALRLRAIMTFTDKTQKKRVYGEEWLVKEPGSYMLGAYEECVEIVYAIPLNEKQAIQVRATKTHIDDFGNNRRHGEEWLITHNESESHILSVNETLVKIVEPVVLRSDNYCFVLDPVDANGVPNLGKKMLVRGEKSFFLLPGESLKNDIESVYVLGEEDGIILRAKENFQDGIENRTAGEEWMLTGPLEYVPSNEVKVVTVRKAIPLDKHEGIYVRDRLSGQVRAVIGSTYMLTENEELWEKDIPKAVRDLIYLKKDPVGDRAYRYTDSPVCEFDQQEFSKVITYRVPHNAVVQVYDYKAKQTRIVFGPEQVMLGPDEQFTLLSLSGGKPKRPNVIKAICLLLGPDFCSDVLIVETADHARLSIQLSYNWHFELSPERTQEEALKLFALPDFIGDFCKTIGARVRGAVASVNFDVFHKNSALLIRQSVFGKDSDGTIKDRFLFTQNNLVVNSVDVQSVEPVDQRTREALQKSVQLAIEITSNSQEAAARHEAERLEQESRGKLERQRIEDEANAEEARRKLLELQVQLAALESTGQAKAEAQSIADAALITSTAEVQKAKFEAEANEIKSIAEIKRLKMARDAELEYNERKNALELENMKLKIELETNYFLNRVEAIGAENLKHIACAGPDRDIRMLEALNLKSTLITDGRQPINLLNATSGLIGQAMNTIHEQRDELNTIVN